MGLYISVINLSTRRNIEQTQCTYLTLLSTMFHLSNLFLPLSFTFFFLFIIPILIFPACYLLIPPPPRRGGVYFLMCISLLSDVSAVLFRVSRNRYSPLSINIRISQGTVGLYYNYQICRVRTLVPWISPWKTLPRLRSHVVDHPLEPVPQDPPPPSPQAGERTSWTGWTQETKQARDMKSTDVVPRTSPGQLPTAAASSFHDNNQASPGSEY